MLSTKVCKQAFLEFFKTAKVFPLFKNGATDDFNNYRPISLLSSLRKCYEKLIYRRLLNFGSKHSLIRSEQYDF